MTISNEQWREFLSDYETHRDIGRAAVRAGFNRNTVYKKMKRDPAFADAVVRIQQMPKPKLTPTPRPPAESTALLF